MIEPGTLVGTLTLVLVVIGGVLMLLRRFLPQVGKRLQFADRLQHQGILALTPQCSVALVRIGQETLVLGVTPHAVTLLTKSPVVDRTENEQDRKTFTDRKDEEMQDSTSLEQLEAGR